MKNLDYKNHYYFSANAKRGMLAPAPTRNITFEQIKRGYILLVSTLLESTKNYNNIYITSLLTNTFMSFITTLLINIYYNPIN